MSNLKLTLEQIKKLKENNHLNVERMEKLRKKCVLNYQDKTFDDRLDETITVKLNYNELEDYNYIHISDQENGEELYLSYEAAVAIARWILGVDNKDNNKSAKSKKSKK